MDWEISSILMMGLLLLICPCAVTAASPVAELHFDEGAGNIAHDSSGHGNNAMIHGATWVDGLTGKALLYDGVNDYTELPHPGILSQGTIEGWVRFSKVPGTYPAGGWMWITISRYPIDQYSDGVDLAFIRGTQRILRLGSGVIRAGIGRTAVSSRRPINGITWWGHGVRPGSKRILMVN
jgi:hypothetical protein